MVSEVVQCRLPQVASCRLRLSPAGWTFFHRPSDWVLHAGALRATSTKQVHAGLKPNVEVWRLIATHEWIDVTLVLEACQGHDGPRVTMARDIRDLRHVRIVGCGSISCRSTLLLS
jgi:hypothetical protein